MLFVKYLIRNWDKLIKKARTFVLAPLTRVSLQNWEGNLLSHLIVVISE